MYDHTVHMRHWGRSGTLLDTQETLILSHSGRKYLYSPPRYRILDFAMSELLLSRIFSGDCFRLLNAMHHTVHMRPWGRPVALLDTLLDTHECGHDYAGICRVCPDLGILDFEMS